MERRTNLTATNSPGAWAYGVNGLEPFAGIPITDRGFRYGLHSFETLRVRDGHAEFVDEHLALLQQSPWASGFSGWAEVRKWLSQGFSSDGILRLYLTAGEGAPTAFVEASRFYIWFESRDVSTQPAAISTALATTPVWPQPGSGKTGNYFLNLVALDAAKARGFGEALLFDPNDELVGACMANVFYRRNGQWFTPPGFRAGVMRQWVLSQITVEVRPLPRAEVAEIEAAFLTSSGIGIVPIHAIEGRRLKDEPLVNQLRAEWVGSPILDHRAIPTQGRAVSMKPPSSL